MKQKRPFRTVLITDIFGAGVHPFALIAMVASSLALPAT